MSALNWKLIRDLLHMKGQALAICLVIASGVTIFVMSLSTVDSLKETQLAYYEHYNFGHIFAHLKRAPNSLAERIIKIPGVSRAETRIVVDVNLDVEGMTEPAVGRLISIPDKLNPGLNKLHLRRGRFIEPRRTEEILASEAFAEAHGFEPGDKIAAVINGRWEELKIVGIVLSPEYVYQIRAGDFFPDDKRFGVFWMEYDELAAAYDMDGAFNDISIVLMPGASVNEVLRPLDRLIEPYGGLGAYSRSDQVSHLYIDDEIKQLRNMSMIFPSIFLTVAAFLLNVVFSRLISTQREQIAVLKAFGYTRLEVGLHYLKLVLVIVVFGVCLGTVVGARLGYSLTNMYTNFFRFPIFEYQFNSHIVLLAFLFSSVAAILGAFNALGRAFRIPPSEAMKPEPPAIYRQTLIERLGLQRLFSHSIRMIIRYLERQPIRAFTSSFSIALAVALLILGNFMSDAIDYLTEFEFEIVQRQDITISFVEPTSAQALYEVQHLPGIRYSEPFRNVPTRLRFGHRSRRIGIMGLAPGAKLHRLIDDQLHPVSLPPEGLVLSEKLSELLGASIGDIVTVEVFEGSMPVREVSVTGIVAGFVGTAAYMDIRALNHLMREGDSLSGAFLFIDSSRLKDLYRVLKTTPRIASVNVKKAALVSFQETLAESLLWMKTINVIFASIIAFGVVYNCARISLSERSRELASLRVLGFTRREISFILLGELGILTLVAIPIGLGIGYGFAFLATLVMSTETHRIPAIVNRSTYAFAVSVIIIAVLISGLIVRRMLNRLDLIAVLKTKE